MSRSPRSSRAKTSSSSYASSKRRVREVRDLDGRDLREGGLHTALPIVAADQQHLARGIERLRPVQDDDLLVVDKRSVDVEGDPVKVSAARACPQVATRSGICDPRRVVRLELGDNVVISGR